MAKEKTLIEITEIVDSVSITDTSAGTTDFNYKLMPVEDFLKKHGEAGYNDLIRIIDRIKEMVKRDQEKLLKTGEIHW